VPLQKPAARQIPDLLGRDAGVGTEVEFLKGLHLVEASAGDSETQVVVRATLDLVLQEELQEVQVAQVAILGLVDALFDGGEHAAQLEELELLL